MAIASQQKFACSFYKSHRKLKMKSKEILILGNLVRRCEQLECLIENYAYLKDSEKYSEVGRTIEEIDLDSNRAKAAYSVAFCMLKSYCKRVGSSVWRARD